jgi:hypothetical protein
MWRVPTVALALASPLAACQFDAPVDQQPIDARLFDAAPACVADTIVCDDAQGVYTECDATGTVVRQMTCPLGCAPDVEKCLDIDPYNGLAMYLDMVEDPPDVVVSGTGTIDDGTGLLFDDGRDLAVPAFQDGTSGAWVLVVNSLQVTGQLVLPATAQPRRALAIVARGDISIRGPIRIDADGPLAGAGGQPPGEFGTDCSGANVHHSSPDTSPGASGGGAATAGGAGGETTSASPTGGGLPLEADSLFGGCAGGTVFFAGGSSVRASGGAGGGAIQLASRTSIVLSDAGSIDASGGGARAGGVLSAGAGGGGGGRVFLEAPQVVLNGPGVVLSTKGGGGSGASGPTTGALGQPGEDGGTAPVRAQGGMSPVQSNGGAGGNETADPGGGGYAGGTTTSGGGGGGAPGNVFIFTQSGVVAPANGAAIRSRLVAGRLTTRIVP